MCVCVWTKTNDFMRDFPYSYGGCSGGHLDDGGGRKVFLCSYASIVTVKAVLYA
jgi:hypothetical protein